MDRQVLYLVHHLRKAGVRITLAETMDCLRGLTIVEWDKDLFYAVLKATLIKNQRDFRLFNKLFELLFDDNYFLNLDKRKRFGVILNPTCQGHEGCSGDAEVMGQGGSQQGSGLSSNSAQRLLQVIQVGSPDQMEEFIKEGLAVLGPIQREHLEHRDETLRRVKVHLEWKRAEFELEKMAGQVPEQSLLDWQSRFSLLEEILVDYFDKLLVESLQEEALEVILERHNLNQLDFYQLSHNQVTEMKKIITKLAHGLASRVSRRRVIAKRGQVDVRRTIRKSMSTGGVFVRMAFRGRKPTKPQLVILCDLSGSVKVFSEFMLQLVYSMQQRFVNARSFAFVDTVEEITDYFRHQEVDQAIGDVYNKGEFSLTGFSEYGQALRVFCEKYGDAITGKTSVIILGDGRNNYQPPQLEYLQWIKDTAKKIIWLNPEPVNRWNQEDSIILQYQSICNQLWECRNLFQLDKVVRNIF